MTGNAGGGERSDDFATGGIVPKGRPRFISEGDCRCTFRTAAASKTERIIEGRCPTCDGPLERRERDGWCTACNVGWAYRSTGPKTATVSLTIEPRIPPALRHLVDPEGLHTARMT